MSELPETYLFPEHQLRLERQRRWPGRAPRYDLKLQGQTLGALEVQSLKTKSRLGQPLLRWLIVGGSEQYDSLPSAIRAFFLLRRQGLLAASPPVSEEAPVPLPSTHEGLSDALPSDE